MNKQTEASGGVKKKEGKTDRRIIRTKRAIYNAMTELMMKKPLDQITVTDIARNADINRKTFYTYYSSPEDVISEAINETLKAFAADMEKFDFQKSDRDPEYAAEFIVKHRPKSQVLECSRLLDSNQDRVWEKMCNIMKENARKHIRRKMPSEDPDLVDYITEFMFSGYYRLNLLYKKKNHETVAGEAFHAPDTEFIRMAHRLMKSCFSVLKNEKKESLT